jgi:hypothetical protein
LSTSRTDFQFTGSSVIQREGPSDTSASLR